MNNFNYRQMILLISFLFNLFIISQSKLHLWEPDEIKNPLTNPQFCNVQNSFVCDPEDILPLHIKKKLSDYLLRNIPKNTPCFCDEGCDVYDYRRRLMMGIVVVSAINENTTNCSKEQDVNDCFSERVLQNWNITLCKGNNGLVLVTKKGTHVYFGAAMHKRISSTCIIRLKSFIRSYIPLTYNLRTLFRHTIQYVLKPCMCNDSCSYRHLKWLTNVVFFMGVIVLVTCIGGMSRRALVSKFHDRPSMRSNIFSSSFYRPRLIGVTPIPARDTGALHITSDQHPPDYSSIGPLPKPPPYIPCPDINFPKHSNNNINININNSSSSSSTRGNNNELSIDTDSGPAARDPTGDDQPPAYALVVGERTNNNININNNNNNSNSSNSSSGSASNTTELIGPIPPPCQATVTGDRQIRPNKPAAPPLSLIHI